MRLLVIKTILDMWILNGLKNLLPDNYDGYKTLYDCVKSSHKLSSVMLAFGKHEKCKASVLIFSFVGLSNVTLHQFNQHNSNGIWSTSNQLFVWNKNRLYKYLQSLQVNIRAQISNNLILQCFHPFHHCFAPNTCLHSHFLVWDQTLSSVRFIHNKGSF